MPAIKTMDPAEREARSRRMQERRWLLAAAGILALGLLLTFRARTRPFEAAEGLLRAKQVVNLSAVESSRDLLAVFGAVYPDPADRRLAAEHLYAWIVRERSVGVFPRSLPNVGVLNTAAVAVPAERAASGGAAFRERLETSATGHVPLLGGAADLRKIKPLVVVRTPQEYTGWFWGLALLHGGCFFLVHLFWHRRRFAGDAFLLPVVYLLSGLALLVLFSLQDPLRDLLYAAGFVLGVAAGCLVLGAASQVDFQGRLWRRYPAVWLLLSLLTAGALYGFGSGPTGSGARVNLHLPGVGSLQPVEFIKLFLVLFGAAYFARNWAFLRELTQREGLPVMLRRLNLPRYRDLLPVAAGVALVLGLFYALQDMGPALVVGCTFLVLYGIVRHRWLAVAAGLLAMLAGFWAAYRFQLVPMVAGRIEMLLSPWDNFTRGGEHLAHAYWALAVGGATGQGLGHGAPGYIPAAHTDMVLAALGEEMGLAGLVVVLLLYAVLLHRAFRIALHAGGVYSLFLGLGIALLTLFQMALIAGGTLGLVPLSGVVTPFLSYGKSSMICNLAMVGVLMSLSARPGLPVQEEAQRRHFGRPVRMLTLSMALLLGGIATRAAYLQLVAADSLAVRPALVLRSTAERAYTYNPRIFDAGRRLTRGTIYDRNGIPLATSRAEELDRFRPVYEALGVDFAALDLAAPRHYPFGALTFYLLGDVRSRVKWGADNSLYAEHAYLSHLRGYDNRPDQVEKRTTPGGRAATLVRYNYAALLPLVRYGDRSPEAQALLQRPRDLWLTVDVRLQRRVAEVLRRGVPEGRTASAVVLEAATGEVLASVTYPLPEGAFTDPAAAHRDEGLFDRGFGSGAKPPGSTLKLVTAIAALGRDPAAAAWTRDVGAWDRYARRGEPTGRVTLERALIASSNVYFAALAAEVVGADTLLQTLEAFGFRVGRPGLTRRQKLALLHEPDNLRQVGFGQGPVTASPLQVALVAATLANGGLRPEARWVRDVNGSIPAGRALVAPEHAALLAGAMRRVVTAREGTARGLRAHSVPIAGKTGTAEELRLVRQGGHRVPVLVDHAWFTGFAPYHAPGTPDPGPKIAVAVLVEAGGSGGGVAAPLAGAIVEAAADLGLIRRD